MNIGNPEAQQEYLENYQGIAAVMPPLLDRLAALAGHYAAYREGFEAVVQRLKADPALTPQQANSLMKTYKGNIPILETDMTAVVKAGNEMLKTVSARAICRGRDAG